MKPLLLWSLFFVSTHAVSAGEMFDQNIQKKFITTIKDHEVTSILQKTKEFDECRKLNEFDPKDSSKGNLKGAVDCFQKKLTGKNPEELQAISDNLGLQSFGLVQSKNKAEIQAYLSDKMYQALTGIDLREKNKEKLMESMKFKNHKQIDQKIFIDLYTAQLTKNALFEVSRFCFENLRLEKPTTGTSEESDFSTYWGNKISSLKLDELTDTGTRGLGKFNGEKDKIYEEIFQNVGLNAKTNLTDMGTFFDICRQAIGPLCKSYEQSKGTADRGANACLVQGKLSKIRKALTDAETIKKEEFEKMADNGTFQIIFDDGQTAEFENNKSIDDLTANSSSSILNDQISNASDEAAKRCKDGTNLNSQECQNFVQIGDDFKANIHKQEMEMTFKSEAEKVKISKLIEAKDETTINQYLEQRGYFDIIEDLKTNANLNVAERVGEKLDAEKNAALAIIKKKLGRRQLTESDTGNGNKERVIQENAKDISEERARLAQVVLFNNIITSQLDIKNNTTKKSAGRNISGIKKEISELKNNPNVNTSFFEGLQKTVDDPSNSSAENNGALSGTGLIDSILGKKEDPTKPEN